MQNTAPRFLAPLFTVLVLALLALTVATAPAQGAPRYSGYVHDIGRGVAYLGAVTAGGALDTNGDGEVGDIELGA